MEERFIEIRFCLFIESLLSKFRFTQAPLELVESYCSLAGIDSINIRKNIQDIRRHGGPIVTYKEEIIYVGKQLGISYRDIAKMADIAKSTIYRTNKLIESRPELFYNIKRKLPDNEYEDIQKFMRVVDIVKEL